METNHVKKSLLKAPEFSMRKFWNLRSQEEKSWKFSFLNYDTLKQIKCIEISQFTVVILKKGFFPMCK